MRLILCALASVLALSFASPLFAAPVLIDGFTQGPITETATGNGAIVGANQTSVDAINGMRAFSISHLFDDGSSTLTLSSGGPLTFSGNNNYLTLGYGETYIGGGMGGGPNLHANLSGSTGLQITFPAGGSSAGIQLFMTSPSGEIDDNGFGTPKHSGDTTVFIPYTSLFNGNESNFDFADVDSILLTFQNQGSLSISQISTYTVPEPMTLMPLAALALAMRRRRSQG